MFRKVQVIVVIAILFCIPLACNAPTSTGGTGSTQLPPQARTLTALVQGLTPGANSTATLTLPAVITATVPAGNQGGAQATNTPSGNGAVATQAPGGSAPTATRGAPQPTIPNTRPRGQVTARFLTTAPTIDGDWSEWKDTTQEYPANSVVFGRENRTGDEDLAGSFHVGWDNSYLYIAVKVRDDRYVQNTTGENLFKGDSIEILLDTHLQEDFYYNQVSPDDFQLGISPGRPDANGTKEAYLWLPSNVAGARSGITVATLQESGQYRVEAAIPWHIFEVTPTADSHMGFVLSISDNDDPNSSAQQSMVSSDADRRLTDPTTWGDIHFTR